MTDDLKKLKDLIEIVVSKVRSIETHQTIAAEQMRMIRDQQAVMNDKLDIHTESLVSIEDTLKGYSDMYEVNKEKNEELESRVEKIENKLTSHEN